MVVCVYSRWAVINSLCDTVTFVCFQIVFFPTAVEKSSKVFTIMCDNSQVKDITIEGECFVDLSKNFLELTLQWTCLDVHCFLCCWVSQGRASRLILTSCLLVKRRNLLWAEKRSTSPRSTLSISVGATLTLCNRKSSSLETTCKPQKFIWLFKSRKMNIFYASALATARMRHYVFWLSVCLVYLDIHASICRSQSKVTVILHIMRP